MCGLLREQFTRLCEHPEDTRLLKQLSVELGAVIVRGCPDGVSRYGKTAAAALQSLRQKDWREDAESHQHLCTALITLLNVAECAYLSILARDDGFEDVPFVTTCQPEVDRWRS